LFFLDEFLEIKNQYKKQTKYNLLFLGTAHSDRYIVSSYVKNWCKKNGLKYYFFYYIQGRLVYLYKFFFDKSFKNFKYRDLSFRSLSLSSILELYKESDVILDINHPGQIGLTMRTFESIGSGKKIITTNREIKKYTFYNPNNIYVIDRNDIDINIDFFKSDYIDLDDKILDKMSLEGWLKSIFFDNEPNIWINGLE
jgi:hypothetical protein